MISPACRIIDDPDRDPARRVGGPRSRRLARTMGATAAFAVIAALAMPLAAPSAAGVRPPAEPARAVARRLIGPEAAGADAHLIDTLWNRRRTLFVDYPGGEDRVLVALQRRPGGGWQRFDAARGEPEGGPARVAAIGFANADRDPARELIVILAWTIRHYDVAGTLYSVRILDDPSPGRRSLAPLPTLARLGLAAEGCDCDRRDEADERFPLATIAAVRRALRRGGY